MEPVGVALVLLARGENAEELGAGRRGGRVGAGGRGPVRRQLVEAGVEAEGVVAAAHQAHAADVLSVADLA